MKHYDLGDLNVVGKRLMTLDTHLEILVREKKVSRLQGMILGIILTIFINVVVAKLLN